ncbi:metallophosphoesterase family protein [Bacillus sp. PS06]|uniref:metallophosphoesterase family protein n=1 Tax=Bacillus sp. PS06 TaxID=2764176 RepID=UPI00177F0BA5|nr:metallophosphoesterase family protein [Bacillus sp. PS06]MBD8070600.1 metallophosphoesterase family protein [Bacillus sp. PS06]
MKIAFISDIHGHAVALDAVLADLEDKNVDKVYVLGDLCFRGPEPKRALELIRGLNTEVIKGNADEWVIRGVEKGEVPDQALELMNKERDWTVSKLDEADLTYLENLPTSIETNVGGVKIHAFHATPESLFDIILPEAEDDKIIDTFMTGQAADIYVYAHIHKPYVRYIGGRVIMNIGSVGLPFDGLAKASYGMIEVKDGTVSTTIHRVRTDIEKTIAMYQESDYPNAEMMCNIVKNGRIGK